MSVLQTLIRRAAVASATATLAVVALPTTGHAFSGSPATLAGKAACDPSTGHQIVTWTFANPTGTSITVNSAVVDSSGLTAGSEIDASTTFTPNPIADGASAVATTASSGDAKGSVVLNVDYTYESLDPAISATVRLAGGCEPAVVATTALATTTTAALPAAQIQPRFTG